MIYLKYYSTITLMFGAACFFFYPSIYPVGDNREFSKSNSQLFTGRVSDIKCKPQLRGGSDNLIIAWRAEDNVTQFYESIQLSEGCRNYPLKSMSGGQISIRVQGGHILAFSVDDEEYLNINDGIKQAARLRDAANSLEITFGVILLLGGLLCLLQLYRFKKSLSVAKAEI